MAELHIERKERSIWPWVLAGLLLLALLLWFLFGRGDRDPMTTGFGAGDTVAATVPTTAAGDETLPAAVNDFVRFSETRDGGAASQSHDYTANGLRRLADALGAVTQGVSVPGIDVNERLSALRSQADAMQRDPASTQHALQAREAFLLASGLMGQLREARFTGLTSEVGDVNAAASAVQANRPLLDQTNEVQRFFDRAAHAVREMARAN